jgi:general secretion pathway protein H
MPALPTSRSKIAPRRGRRSGFTLIEVIVVLGVMALITAIAVPRLTGAQAKTDLQAAARELAAALRSTRNLAMTSGRAEIFSVDTASGAFRPGASRMPSRVPSGIRLLLVTTTDDQVNATTGGIRFFADGSSTGGGVRLSNGKAGNDVLVDWLTGSVSIGNGVHAAAR